MINTNLLEGRRSSTVGNHKNGPLFDQKIGNLGLF
jgi:hypothetical protein